VRMDWEKVRRGVRLLSKPDRITTVEELENVINTIMEELLRIAEELVLKRKNNIGSKVMWWNYRVGEVVKEVRRAERR